MVLFAALSVAALICAAPSRGQFTLQTSNTTADLRGIHNVGNGVAWASGTNGTVLRTEDGGYVWQSCAVPAGAEKLDFRGVQAFDANTAIVMSSGPGDQSRLYKTTDGCHTWKLLFRNPDKDGFWDALHWAARPNTESLTVLGDPVGSRMTLFAMNPDNTLMVHPKIWYGNLPVRRQLQLHDPNADPVPQKSNEAQDSPNNLQHNPTPLAKEAFFAASNSSYVQLSKFSFAFAGGGPSGARAFVYDCQPFEGRVVHCDWITSELPMAHSESAGAFSISANRTTTGNVLEPNGVTLIAVGGDYRHPDSTTGTAAFTIDFARHWLPTQTPPHGYRSSVAYDASSKTWITVGPNGTDISTDDGRNWRPVHPNAALHEPEDADRNWNALSLPYVVGPKGRIGKVDPSALQTSRYSP